MKRGSVQDYVESMKKRYGKAGRSERGRLLDEFVEVTGYHRKSANRLLRGKAGGSGGDGRTGRPREYGSAVTAALRQVWEVADRPCGRRLAPFMGSWWGGWKRGRSCSFLGKWRRRCAG